MEGLFSIGINHSNSNATLRSRLALHEDQQIRLYQAILNISDNSFFILNTCNRTEIYGYGEADIVIEAYLDILEDKTVDSNSIVKKSGQEALTHIFKVASGLDSQLIGDLEILGQFKLAIKKAKQFYAIDGYLERLTNMAIQAAKEIKNQTKISTGTTSLSYATIQYIKRVNPSPMRVLLIGTGEFGKRIAYNAKDYLPGANLTLCNRTLAKAQELAKDLDCQITPFDQVYEAIDQHDIIISSVNDSGFYIIDQSFASSLAERKTFIDMSIPISIDPVVVRYGHTLVNIDEISREVDQTIASRKEELPVALQIIDRYIQEFNTWESVFEKSASLYEWKKIMTHLSQTCPHLKSYEREARQKMIQKSLAEFAKFIKKKVDLPKEPNQVIHQFLEESDHAVACQKSTDRTNSIQFNHCNACQL